MIAAGGLLPADSHATSYRLSAVKYPPSPISDGFLISTVNGRTVDENILLLVLLLYYYFQVQPNVLLLLIHELLSGVK